MVGIALLVAPQLQCGRALVGTESRVVEFMSGAWHPFNVAVPW